LPKVHENAEKGADGYENENENGIEDETKGKNITFAGEESEISNPESVKHH